MMEWTRTVMTVIGYLVMLFAAVALVGYLVGIICSMVGKIATDCDEMFWTAVAIRRMRRKRRGKEPAHHVRHAVRMVRDARKKGGA